MPTAVAFSVGGSQQEGTWPHGIQKHLIPGEHGGQPGRPLADNTLTAGPPLGSGLGETSGTGLVFMGPSPSPVL